MGSPTLHTLGGHDCDQHAALASGANKSAGEAKGDRNLYRMASCCTCRLEDTGCVVLLPARASQLHDRSRLLPGGANAFPPAPHSLAERPLAPLFF